jgi:ABC-2 type transport system permease protein
MAGTSIIVLTSVLAGSFYDMGDAGTWFGKLLYLLPQKDFVYFIEQWEKNLLNSNAITGLVYVIICSAIFITVGVIKTSRDYIYHRS